MLHTYFLKSILIIIVLSSYSLCAMEDPFSLGDEVQKEIRGGNGDLAVLLDRQNHRIIFYKSKVHRYASLAGSSACILVMIYLLYDHFRVKKEFIILDKDGLTVAGKFYPWDSILAIREVIRCNEYGNEIGRSLCFFLKDTTSVTVQASELPMTLLQFKQILKIYLCPALQQMIEAIV